MRRTIIAAAGGDLVLHRVPAHEDRETCEPPHEEATNAFEGASRDIRARLEQLLVDVVGGAEVRAEGGPQLCTREEACQLLRCCSRARVSFSVCVLEGTRSRACSRRARGRTRSRRAAACLFRRHPHTGVPLEHALDQLRPPARALPVLVRRGEREEVRVLAHEGLPHEALLVRLDEWLDASRQRAHLWAIEAARLVQQLRQVDGPGALSRLLVQRHAEAEATLREGGDGSGGQRQPRRVGTSRARTTTPTRSGGCNVWKARTRQSRSSLGRSALLVHALSFSTAATRARLASSHESQLAGRGAKSRSCFARDSHWRRRFCHTTRAGVKGGSRQRRIASRASSSGGRGRRFEELGARTTSSSTGQMSALAPSRLSA